MVDHSETLSPPKRTDTFDPGAHELSESDSEDHFSDAQEGTGPRAASPGSPRSPSGTPSSPIPKTRVEKVTLDPSYGEVPGTEAWLKRAEDAEPDEIALVPDEREQARLAVLHAAAEARQAKSPPVPITVVQETEDVAGSTTHKPSAEWAAHHAADAPPDLVLPPPSHAATGSDGDGGHGAAAKPPAVPGSSAVEADKGEGSPTAMKSAVGAEASTDTPMSAALRSPGLSGSARQWSSQVHSRSALSSPLSPPGQQYSDALGDDANWGDEGDGSGGGGGGGSGGSGGSGGGGDDEGFGDDFDDFEEGDEDADFGEFNDGNATFEAPPPPPPQQQPTVPAPPPVPSLPFPVPDLEGLDTPDLPPLLTPYLELLYPPASLSPASESFPPPLTRAKADNPVFLTPRSASLWQQLVAPPPLQPPDWIRSRIRRLFLVSLGVPVDLDEILDPRKKQKKLVLPSIHQHRTGSSSRHRSRGPAGGGGSARNSTDSQRGTVSRLKKEESADSAAGKRSSSHGPPGRSSTWGPSGAPGSSASASASGRSPSPRPSTSTGRPKPPEPDLDMVSARRLCATTDEALQGMTDDELRQHVAELQRLEELAAEALEYWRARADEQIGEREAFEGVIENLVKHARKVRK